MAGYFPPAASILGARRPRISNVGHTVPNSSVSITSPGGQAPWLTPDRLARIRSILLGVTLFVGLLVWTAFSLGLVPRGTHLVAKLRVIGVMTWVYALIQIIDMKVWHSRFAAKRRAASRIPESLEGWLLAQMIAWFGIAYYALTDDARWYVAGLVLFLLSFVVFPIRDSR